MRHFNFIDQCIITCDSALRTLTHHPTSHRAYPAAAIPEATLTIAEKNHIAGLMRVNHAGEVCAQALYQGQALCSRHPHIKEKMATAAREELDHLMWCQIRLSELGSQTSYLCLLWYSGSLLIGIFAGLCGDAWNLGFLEATEQQVTAHLEQHLQALPPQDLKTTVILNQMRIDEGQHAMDAHMMGAKSLPNWMRRCMHLTSKIMTNIAYHF